MLRYVYTLNQLLTRRIISNLEINSCLQRTSISVRYFVAGNSYQRKPILTYAAHRNAFTINDLLLYINSGKFFYLKQLTKVFHTIDFDTLKSEEAVTLLKCCGSSVPDSSREQRNKVCQDIFTGLQKNNHINIDVYNTYLKTCTENSVYVNHRDFLATLKSEPNKDTFKLLLRNVCQQGQVSDALLILELMKNNQIPVDADIFNNLILAHAIEGGLDLAETVLKTMRSAQLADNDGTRLAMLIALIRRNDLKEFKKAVKEYPIRLMKSELLTVIEELGLRGNESWLADIYDFDTVPATRELQNEVEKICIHLIHMAQPKSSMNIYKKIVTPLPEELYGYKLLKEMLHCNVDINTIIIFAKDLAENEYNEYILENLTEVTLRFKYIEQSWALLRSLKTLRPHYFWPLLAHCGKRNGVFSVLENIKGLNVKPDAETLEMYVFPYCDLSDLKLLVLKLQDGGITVREILSPLIIVLLKQKRIRQAVNLCNLYNVNISGDKLLKSLSMAWGYTQDATSILILLRRFCESNITEQDLVGQFLISCSKFCQNNEDFKELLKLIRIIGENRLRISIYSGDMLQEIIKNCSNENLRNETKASVNSILDFGLKLSEEVTLIHPSNMDLAGLECHLIELQEKKMETRGVIRKLIQMHASKGNLERVAELRRLFLDSGYEESAGIRSSVMHSYVLGGHLDEAINVYRELISLNPEFTLDSFKFIDLAKLLIQRDKFDEGYSILQNEIAKSKRIGNAKSISRNCRELLSSCKNGKEVEKVFSLLVKNGLCKPTNVMLGPLVKIELKNKDLTKAVNKYVELSQKYHCTPLQLEMLCAVSKEENSELLQKVMKATEAVHGPGPAQMGLISALAENGQEKALRKTLSIINVSIKGLLKKRCEHWVEEGKMEPLKCLIKACGRLPAEIVDIHFIYKCIFNLFDLNGDYAGALQFYNTIPEELTLRMYFEKDLEKIHDKQYNVNNNVKIRNTI